MAVYSRRSGSKQLGVAAYRLKINCINAGMYICKLNSVSAYAQDELCGTRFDSHSMVRFRIQQRGNVSKCLTL